MGYVINGKKYIRNTLTEWIAPANFPHWSLQTVRRVFKKLEEVGVLIKKNLTRLRQIESPKIIAGIR